MERANELFFADDTTISGKLSEMQNGAIRVGSEADVRKRIKRASGLHASVKEKLKCTYLSKNWQARIVEACVESALLFDCQVRVWCKKT